MSTSLQNIDILLITHVVFNKNLPTAGPYSSVIKSLQNKTKSLRVLEIPLYNFDEPIIYGDPLSLSKLKISKFLGIVPPIKYVIDIIITIFFLLKFLIQKSKHKVVISIDPLSAIIPSIFRRILNIKSIFYCVDFNENRFKNKILQRLYEGADKISSIHSDFLKNNLKVGYKEITGWWRDTGKPEDLIIANQLLLEEIPAENFKIEGKVEDGAVISNKVRIGVGTTINKNVKIFGPALIGENCSLEDCVINPNTTIGVGSTIKNAEIKDSIILNKCNISCDIKLAGSIIGSGATVIKNESGRQKMVLGENTLIEI